MHVDTYFWNFLCYMKIQYDFLYIYLRDLAVCMKTKHFFWQNPGILIPDLYLYIIKIQTNINQNAVKKFLENHRFFKGFFFWNCFWLGPARPMWRGWTQQAWLGHWPKPVTRLNNLKHAWISSLVHELYEGN